MNTVLIVEDNVMNLELLVQLLSDDYSVITARDGAKALELARQHPLDLVLMDLSLPVLDGWEATRQLKADPNLNKIPVIALTAHAMPGDEAAALEAGCDIVLTKPVDEDELFATLRDFLGDASSE